MGSGLFLNYLTLLIKLCIQWAEDNEYDLLCGLHVELLHQAFLTVQSVDVGSCTGRHCHLPPFLVI
jgi:hypothetical protein